MDIIYGCVFIEIADILNQTDITGNRYYDWGNKQTFPLLQSSLDDIIYTLSNKDTFTCIKNDKDYYLTLTSYGAYKLEFKDKEVASDSIELVSVNSLRFMLEQAKIKTYGWD